jgi:hypothetical protein
MRLIAAILLASSLMLLADPLTSDRRVAWYGNVGIPNGIPSNRTIFTNMTGLDVTGVTNVSPQINAAITACTAGQIVKLPAGTLRVDNTLLVNQGITLGGAGMDQTFLLGPTNYSTLTPIDNGYYAIIALFPSTLNLTSDWENNISSGATNGSTNIVLAAANTHVKPGYIINIYETNGIGFFNYGDIGTRNQTYTLKNDTHHGQLVEVLTVDPSYTIISFHPPIYMTFTNQAVMGYKQCSNVGNDNTLRGAGIESLTVRNRIPSQQVPLCGGAPLLPVIFLDRATQCWVKNVKTVDSYATHIHVLRGFQNEIRDCTATNQVWYWTSGGYGMYNEMAYASIWENNLFQNTRDFVRLSKSSAGNVVLYNYHTNRSSGSAVGIAKDVTTQTSDCGTNLNIDPFTTSTGGSHSCHPMFNLWEGNVTYHPRFDNTHGSASDFTLLRNWFRGPQFWEYNYASIIDMEENHSRFNIIGNVLGSLSVSNAYAHSAWVSFTQFMCNPSAYGNGVLPTYAVGYNKNPGEVISNSYSGMNLFTNYIVMGNYEFVGTNAQVWRYPTNMADTIPNSYYYTAKPAYFGSLTWPPIDPTLVAATPITVDTMIDFEGQAEGTVITTTVMTNVTKGNLFLGFDTCASGCSGYQTSGGCTTDISPGAAVPNLTITTNAACPLNLPVTIGGVTYSTAGTNGLRVKCLDNNAIRLKFAQPGFQDSIGFNFRFGGSQVSYYAHDLVTLRNRSHGTFQFMQAYDPPGNTTYAHAHWNCSTCGSFVGNDINLIRNHWYWIAMDHVASGASMNISFYDAENGYNLVGTSVGAVTGNDTFGATELEFGLVKYAKGTNSWWVDYDNLMIATNGAFPLGPPIPSLPTMGETNTPAGYRNLYGTNPPAPQLAVSTNFFNFGNTFLPQDPGDFNQVGVTNTLWLTNVGNVSLTIYKPTKISGDGSFFYWLGNNGFTLAVGQATNMSVSYFVGPVTFPPVWQTPIFSFTNGGTQLIQMNASYTQYEPPNTPTGAAASLVANNFSLSGGTLKASGNTVPFVMGQSGTAYLLFQLTNRSSVTFTAYVQATNTVNSFAVAVDGTPVYPYSVFDLTATDNNFTNQVLNLRGVGSVASPDLPAAPWLLDGDPVNPVSHFINIVSQTAGTAISNIVVNITPITPQSQIVGGVTISGGSLQ